MNHKPVGGSLFYTHPKTVREVRAGYLHKSPPLKLITTEKAWKRRFFILFKLSDTEYQLRYFKSSEEKDKRAGEIDLVSLLHVSPQHHPKWNWIQKSFKCSPSCVLLIRATERDYFLVGENRSVIAENITIPNGSRDHEVEDVNKSTLMRTVTQTFDKLKTQVSPLPPFAEETNADDNRYVSGWTGQPQTVCLFHKGDQILAVNDLHVSTVEEFTMFISKSLKNESRESLYICSDYMIAQI
uniref:Pleckstrin homology domain containing S1, tandem duplicate 3 n=1 Tax=Oreochromis niloticus TaxID=8128 RepID=A0A669B9A3_ORENI